MLRNDCQEYKFNIIRIYSSWVYHNREPERFNFEELEEVMGYCDEFGLRVLMGVITEDAPYWLEAAHPETRYVDANDQPLTAWTAAGTMSAGAGRDCASIGSRCARRRADSSAKWRRTVGEASVDVRLRLLERTAHRARRARIASRPPTEERSVLLLPQDHCRISAWLERRYGTLDRLNEAWVRGIPDWKVIDPPRRTGTYADWVDWRRFIIDRSTG